MLSERQAVDESMRLRYGIGLDAMEVTETPGYWRDIEPQIHEGHPLHSFMFCGGPFKATYTYFDPVKGPDGRFQSRTKTWRILKDAGRAALEQHEKGVEG